MDHIELSGLGQFVDDTLELGVDKAKRNGLEYISIRELAVLAGLSEPYINLFYRLFFLLDLADTDEEEYTS